MIISLVSFQPVGIQSKVMEKLTTMSAYAKSFLVLLGQLQIKKKSNDSPVHLTLEVHADVEFTPAANNRETTPPMFYMAI